MSANYMDGLLDFRNAYRSARCPFLGHGNILSCESERNSRTQGAGDEQTLAVERLNKRVRMDGRLTAYRTMVLGHEAGY
jgi:hypothetical protein